MCTAGESNPSTLTMAMIARPRANSTRVLRSRLCTASVILSYAADRGVDLIVIGAYSHARAVEMVFGGVTRTLLKQSPIPVLMSR
jgi:nucleotide-binding universal stress UspA family protein